MINSKVNPASVDAEAFWDNLLFPPPDDESLDEFWSVDEISTIITDFQVDDASAVASLSDSSDEMQGGSNLGSFYSYISYDRQVTKTAGTIVLRN